MSRPPVLKVAPESWLRVPERGTYAGAVTCVVFAIFWVFMGVLVAVKFAGEGIGVIAFVLFFFVIAAVCATLAVRIPRAGLWIDADGVTVRGVTKTTRVPLRVVEEFAARDLGMGGAIRTTVGVTLRRRRERELIVWSMRHGEFTGKAHREKALARWQPVCDELNDLVRSFAGAAVAPTPSRSQ